jgi:hypothetical protein
VAGRPDQAEPPPPATSGRLARLLRPSGAWLAGIAATLVATLAVVLGAQIFDAPAMLDWIRGVTRDGDDIRFGVTRIGEAGPLQLATPAGVRLTPRQERYLRNWSFTNMNPEGYGDRIRTDLMAAGAASVDRQYVTIKLESRRNQPIHVDNIAPVNIKRSKPYRGTLVNLSPQEGGETLKMLFDFDEAEPRARDIAKKEFEDEAAEPGDLYFRNRTLTLEDGVEDTVVIKSVTREWAVTFGIRIDYRIGDESKHLTLDNNGRPFALTALNCTEPTRRVGSDQGFEEGRVTYEDLWELGSTRMERAADPADHGVGAPYCVPPETD